MLMAAVIGVVGWFSEAQADDKQGITLKGRIRVEGSSENVAFATITLQDDSAKVITKLASDESGRFRLKLDKAGKYVLLSHGTEHTHPSDLAFRENEYAG